MNACIDKIELLQHYDVTLCFWYMSPCLMTD